MIFLTVGSELPFDRLVKAVDLWAKTSHRNDIIGQIADPGLNGYFPANIQWHKFLSAEDYDHYCDKADLIIGHAGMGSIITAALKGKPIIVMPRQAAFKETRNNHQVATVSRLSSRAGIVIAEDEKALVLLLEKLNMTTQSQHISPTGEFAEERLINAIRDFILAC